MQRKANLLHNSPFITELQYINLGNSSVFFVLQSHSPIQFLLVYLPGAGLRVRFGWGDTLLADFPVGLSFLLAAASANL